ncbi:MAG: efflux transporter outer membrane subunit, partial [Croceibacterium sp.]
AGACSTPSTIPPASTLAIPADWPQADVAQSGIDLARYWEWLGDPALSRLEQRALANNRDLAQAAARLDQARAQLRLARAGYLPQVNASGGASKDVGDLARDAVQFSLGADASWEADLFGRIGGSVAASQADLAAAGYSLGDVQRAITGQLALTVINARSLSAQLALTRETLAYQDENLQIARWRNQAGLVSSLDVEQARSQRAQTAATVPQLENSLAATANAIATLVGEAPGPVYALLEGPGVIPSPDPAAPAAGPAEVLRLRPDVRAAEAILLAASARVGVARAQLLPLVRLTGSISTASPAADLFQTITGGLFASVSQLIFDGGRTRAQIANAEAAARGSLAAWEGTILSALEEVETASTAQRTAAERERILDEALDAASNSALLARSQYRAGLTDFRTLLTAENQLLAARTAALAAQADRASAFVRVNQALGGGWTPTLSPAPATGDRTQP